MSARRLEDINALGNVPLKSKNIAQHNWLYSRHDLFRLMNNFEIFAEMGGIRGVAFALRTNVRDGIYGDEVKKGTYKERQSRYGSNKLPEKVLKTFGAHCKEAFMEDPLLWVLLAAGAISFILGFIEDPASGWYEGIAIWFAIFIVVIVGGGNNWQQDIKFAELNAQQKKPQCKVIRDGQDVTIDSDDLQVGDIVNLIPGDKIPADGVMVADISSKDVKADESSMTGEPDAIKKNFRKPFMIGGTNVNDGSCHMLVTAVGLDTCWGQILSQVQKKKEATELKKKLSYAAEQIGYLGTGCAVVMFLVLLITWIVEVAKGHIDAKSHAVEILEYFIIAITIIVVAVPEGLPLAVNISLAFSMKKMRRDQILVKILSACETMGNVTTICSDKTGTLTQNVMVVEEAKVGDTMYITTPEVPNNANLPVLKMKTLLSDGLRKTLIHSIILNSSAAPEANSAFNKKQQAAGEPPERWAWVLGNKTEVALNSWFIKNNIDIMSERSDQLIVDKTDFSSQTKFSSVIVTQKDGSYRRYFKGASERMIDMCSTVVDKDGNAGTEIDRKAFHDYVTEKAGDGFRTIGFCYIPMELKKDPATNQIILRTDIQDAVMIGCCAIRDPLRPETRHSVRTCQRAGIIVRMVTGDHIATATKIAKDCGIITDARHTAMDGGRFEMLYDHDQEELKRLMPNLRVVARSKPNHKKKLVEFLKAEGEQVAVTGDGTNDAQAMAAAHIGIAMNSGTDVAKGAAHTVIIDDRFSSIVRSVMWGRSVYDNIAKFVQFQLTVNLVALAISLIGASTGYTSPLTAVQLLWVNLIMDTMAALALGTESPSPALLERSPFLPKANLISPVMARNILAQTILQIVVLCILLYKPEMIFANDEGSNHMEHMSERHYTIIFNTFVFLQFFNEINSRKVNAELNIFEKFFDNFYFTGVLIVTLVCQFILVTLVGAFADTVPLNTEDWIICIVLGIVSIPMGFFARVLFNGRFGIIDFDSGRVKLKVDEVFPNAKLKPLEPNEMDFLDIDNVDENASKE